MARKHMAIFNVATGWCHKIADGTHIPRGAFYGRDTVSYWYCINKKVYPLDTPTLEIYRFNPVDEQWYLLIEQSDTVKMIVAQATPEQWAMPIEYPKFTGIHSVSANMDKTVGSRSKCTGLKRGHKPSRVNKHEIPLDIWESVAPMTYEESNGKKRIKRPNWSATQYTEESKPYLR